MDLPSGGKRADHQGLLPVCLLLAVTLAAACSSDPVYLPSVPPSIMSGDLTGGAATLRLTVPMAVENADQADERMKIADELGLTPDQVPTTRRDDTDLEIEWTLGNAGTAATVAQLSVVGANELFSYDPAAFVTDDDEDAPPPLMGGRPIDVPPKATVSGVFREDELYEAAQDLDAITRGGVVPQRALIERWKTPDVTGGEGGALAEIPSEAIPLLLVLDVSVTADQPLTLTAKLRVRDHTGRLRPLNSDPAGIVPASATAFVPPTVP